jgi:hypothetical protein
MDQFTRRLVGVGVHAGAVTGGDVCRMFNTAIHGQGAPRHLSTDHDPVPCGNSADDFAAARGLPTLVIRLAIYPATKPSTCTVGSKSSWRAS